MSYRTLTNKVSLDSVEKAWSMSNCIKDTWNWALEMRRLLLTHNEFISYTQQDKIFTRYKKVTRNSRFKLTPSRTFQFVLKELDSAWNNYFDLKKRFPERNHELPHFRSRKYFHTLTFDQYWLNEEGYLCLGTGKSHLVTDFKLPNHIESGIKYSHSFYRH